MMRLFRFIQTLLYSVSIVLINQSEESDHVLLDVMSAVAE